MAPRSKKKKERKMSEREHSDAVGTAAEVSSVRLICLRYPDKIIIFCPQVVHARNTPASTPQDVSSYLASNSISIESHGVAVVPVLSFDQLEIPPKLLQALKNFQQPTPIQACAWPALLAGHDVIGIAETGRFACSCSRYLSFSESSRQREDAGILLARTRAHNRECRQGGQGGSKTLDFGCSPNSGTCLADSRNYGASWCAFWCQKCLRFWWSGQRPTEKSTFE